MGIFDYKHNKKTEFKVVKKTTFDSDSDEPILQPTETKDSDFDLTEIDTLINLIKSEFNNKTIVLNPLFDSELLNDLEIFQEFIKELLPNFPIYTTKDKNGFVEVSLRSLADTRDYLINEFGNTNPDLTLTNNKSVYLNNNQFQMDQGGVIYKGSEVFLNPADLESINIKTIDFKNQILKLQDGSVTIPFSAFTGVSLLESPNNNQFNGINTVDYTEDPFFVNLVLSNDNLKIKDLTAVEFSDSDLNLDQLNKTIGGSDFGNSLKDYLLNSANYDSSVVSYGYKTCNAKSINFLKLLLLLIVGGGEAGKLPLPATKVPITSTKEVCNYSSYNNYHLMMYSESKKQGLKTSLLQVVHSILKPFFGINIKPLIIKFRLKII